MKSVNLSRSSPPKTRNEEMGVKERWFLDRVWSVGGENYVYSMPDTECWFWVLIFYFWEERWVIGIKHKRRKHEIVIGYTIFLLLLFPLAFPALLVFFRYQFESKRPSHPANDKSKHKRIIRRHFSLR